MMMLLIFSQIQSCVAKQACAACSGQCAAFKGSVDNQTFLKEISTPPRRGVEKIPVIHSHLWTTGGICRSVLCELNRYQPEFASLVGNAFLSAADCSTNQGIYFSFIRRK